MANILHIRPGIAGVSIDIRELIRRLKGQGKTGGGVTLVAERFLSVFEEHGIGPAQIPRFVPELTLAKLASAEALLGALTPSILETTAILFGVRREWLEGVDDAIYRRDYCFKRPQRFFSALSTLKAGYSEFPVRALFSAKNLDWRDERYQPLVLFFVEKFAELGEDDLSRFHIFDEFDWSHALCRIQLKAMARVLNRKFDTVFPLYRVTEAELEEVAEGRRIPRSLMRSPPVTDPSLEDYALSESESQVAKEIEELPLVLTYIEHQGLSGRIQTETSAEGEQ